MVLLVVNIESLACIEYSSMMFIPAKKSDVTNVTKDFGLDDDDTADNESQVDVDIPLYPYVLYPKTTQCTRCSETSRSRTRNQG